MNEDKPYVRQSVDMLEILPLLAPGARCVIFNCIGLFETDPLGASKRDILDYTGLSRPTVENALRFLELSDLVYFTPETRRYRPNPKYVSQRGGKKDVHTLVPILQGERAVKGELIEKTNAAKCKKVFSSPMMDGTKDSNEKSLVKTSIHGNAEIEKILATAFEGVNVQRLAARIDEPETAQAWVDWCNDAYTKKRYRNPQGAAYKELMQTRNAKPPFSPQKQENAVRRPGTITGHLAAFAQLPLEETNE